MKLLIKSIVISIALITFIILSTSSTSKALANHDYEEDENNIIDPALARMLLQVNIYFSTVIIIIIYNFIQLLRNINMIQKTKRWFKEHLIHQKFIKTILK